jgi:hypothetical protein
MPARSLPRSWERRTRWTAVSDWTPWVPQNAGLWRLCPAIALATAAAPRYCRLDH